jgi:hypothetical protein
MLATVKAAIPPEFDPEVLERQRLDATATRIQAGHPD